MGLHRRGEYRHRWNAQSIWTYPKSVVGPGSPRDLVSKMRLDVCSRCLLGASVSFRDPYPYK